MEEKLLQKVAITITDGDLANADFLCPICGKSKIIFSFTKIPSSQRFGLFIECRNCGYRQHYGLLSKPKNFREDLVIEEYQELENQVAKLIKKDG